MEPRRYRVSWEMITVSYQPSSDWHPVNKEHTSLMEAVDQYLTLKGWEVTGKEPVRNVKLEEGVIEWKAKPLPDSFLEAAKMRGNPNANA